jgi:hypothetical protein
VEDSVPFLTFALVSLSSEINGYCHHHHRIHHHTTNTPKNGLPESETGKRYIITERASSQTTFHSFSLSPSIALISPVIDPSFQSHHDRSSRMDVLATIGKDVDIRQTILEEKMGCPHSRCNLHLQN